MATVLAGGACPLRPTGFKRLEKQMRSLVACRGFGFIVLVAIGAAAACTPDFDTTRSPAPRGTVGEELYGVVCDHVGAQALHEDLTGASFNAICHKDGSGTYANLVDQTQLPAITQDATDVTGKLVTLSQQQQTRAHAVARVEALARRRADLIGALDATFPDVMVAVRDLANADPKQSCNPSLAGGGQDKLSHQLADMLGRFTALYDDGTIPQSTESFAGVLNAFKVSPDALASYARFDARQGYRPIDVALGVARPVLAYPGLRDFANTALSLISSDSSPYNPNPKLDALGHRIPTPGAAYPQFLELLTASHQELRTATGDGPIAQLNVLGTDAVGRQVLSRPRTNLEFMQDLFFAQDPSYGGGDSRYIVKRDPRGYASVALVSGKVPAPFVDQNGDGLADVDDLGRFVTSNGQPPPAPFFVPNTADAAVRDTFGRALSAQAGPLVYDYLDTSHTYAASLMSDLKPLVVADPSLNHETLMNALAGAFVLSGSRDGSPKTSKQYAADPDAVTNWLLTHTGPPPPDLGTKPITVEYDAFHADNSPLLDLVYGLAQALGDQTSDDTLAYTNLLFTKDIGDVARLLGDGLVMKANADKHPEAHIPAQSTFWDEMLDVAVQIEKEPGLLEDLLRSFGSDDALPLGQIFSNYSNYNDQISYDKNNLNGPAWNVTTNSGAQMQTPVDRTQPDVGYNRSAFQRFVQLIHDTHGVTFCNKEGAVVHAQLTLPVIGLVSVDMPPTALLGGSYHECEVYKIDDGAKFFLQTIIGKGQLYLRDNLLRTGIAGIGAATVGLMEQSSGLTGFWDDASSQTLRPTPEFVSRQMFFDVINDSPNQGGINYTTNHFLMDLAGPNAGTSVCPERIINDPNPTAPDASPDGKVHGLRSCQAGDYLLDRDKNTIFVWEDFGFYKAMTPMLTAFGNHNREDLFLALMETAHRHWADAQGAPNECKLSSDPTSPFQNCTKDGAVTYEPLLVQQFLTDILPAVHDVMKALQSLTIPHCVAQAPAGGCGTTATVDGVAVMAEAIRSLVDPDRAKAVGLLDRRGNATGLRNDGTTNPQVTPIYLITEALNASDAAFASWQSAHPDDKDRLTKWRLARSQLVDQFLRVTGAGTGSAFGNASLPKIAPTIIGALREQLLAHCPDAFTPPFTPCAWARHDLVQNMQDSMSGPTYGAVMDLVDAIRKDDNGRGRTEALLTYLLDAASQNDALAAMLGSANDMIQLLRDDTNLVPLYHVLSAGAASSLYNENGQLVQAGMMDAQMTLLSRIFGKAFDASNTEICARELDPNQVLSFALQRLVTPMQTADGQTAGTPLETIMDVIADVNRTAPDQTDKLAATDYASIADNVSDFLLNKERGLEQFYAIVRQGTQSE
jgi:hypothetical protein